MINLRTLLRTGAVVLTLAGLASTAAAQNKPQLSYGLDYRKAPGYFPNPLAPYLPTNVPPAVTTNTPRIDSLMKDGKLMLSISDAIALALENNLDLAIARYNLPIADTDVLRTKAGGQVLGVATGVVSGTPGGGVGGLGTGASGAGAGGTAAGAGGAGGGAGGLVQSTLGSGSAIQSYDPQISGQMFINHVKQPITNLVLTGVPLYAQNLANANFTYSQYFPTGTSMQVAFDNNRTADNAKFSTLVPSLTSNFRFQIRQHLLSGFGFGPNTRFIRIAKNNREISDIAFREQVIATVTQIQSIYWDLVSAFEDVQVKQRSLELAQKTLSDNQAQVKLGTLPEIEVTRAESVVAARNQDLIIAQSQLQLQSLLMKNAISRSLDDQFLADAQVIPTDSMALPKQEQVEPIRDLISTALGHRPELAQARIDLTNRQISRKSVNNNLLPSTDLFAWYGGSGLAGQANPLSPPATPLGTGYSDAFTRLFSGDFPDYAVGIQLNIPIRNRQAHADQVRSELEYRQSELRLQQLQNQINIDVRNAQFNVQQDRARVEAARQARDLAQHSLDIEQQKFKLGASTSFDVLTAQSNLGVAESTLVTALSQYEKSRVDLDRATGMSLTHLGIEVDDAERGRVQSLPHVEGATPRADVNPVMPPQQQQ